MSKTLVIRADAGSRMGTGHVMRCIALGQAWKDTGGQVFFVSCCESERVRNRIREEGFSLVELSGAYPTSEEDLLSTLDIAEQTSAAWVVVDGYHFDFSYQKVLRTTGLKVLLIDDCNHLPQYECDLLLNQNMGAEELRYVCNSECQRLLGLPYVMLRREFRHSTKKREIGSSVRNILVTMGGSDPDNVTCEVIGAFRQLGLENVSVKILVGASNAHAESLRDAVKGLSGSVELLFSVVDVPSLICWADFAISAAGSTCWELAALRVPFMTVVLADNQERVALMLEKVAGVKCAGRSDLELQKRLYEFFLEILQGKQSMFVESRNKLSGLVDLLGVDRVLNKLVPDKAG